MIKPIPRQMISASFSAELQVKEIVTIAVVRGIRGSLHLIYLTFIIFY